MITEENGVKRIEFGHGTVIVSSAKMVLDGEITGAALCFWAGDKQEFGFAHPECCGKDAEDNGVDTLVVFPDLKTIDLVMDYLKEARSYLAA